MCQANSGGKADIPAGTRRPRNMYLHSRPTPCQPQDFQFKQFKTRIVFLVQTAKKKKKREKVRLWRGSVRTCQGPL